MRPARIITTLLTAGAVSALATVPAYAVSYTAHPHVINRGYATYNNSANTLKVCDTAADGYSVVAVIEDDWNSNGYIMKKGKGKCQTYHPLSRLNDGKRFSLQLRLAKGKKPVKGSDGAIVWGTL
ncbi:hypothetical protein ACIBK8_30540 [Streptomyces sp. NPDC050161]|uniref:hypothetical protein n=1 Tax=Streptomyces sp. NPDC050161 TaxID=3365604 RepID=UPI0037B6E956